MPFAGYRDFADCVARNQDKDDPEAYCGSIKAKTEGVTVSTEHKPRKAIVTKPPAKPRTGPTPQPPNRITVVKSPAQHEQEHEREITHRLFTRPRWR